MEQSGRGVSRRSRGPVLPPQKGAARCDDAEFLAQLGEHPTRADVKRASTVAQLAAVADRLLAWQEDLTLREHALLAHRVASTPTTAAATAAPSEMDRFEAEFTLVGRKSAAARPAGLAPNAADAAAASAVASVVKTASSSSLDGAGDGGAAADAASDGFCVVERLDEDLAAAAVADALRADPAEMAALQHEQQQQQQQQQQKGKKKKPFMCSEEGCMRFVVHADDALHKCACCGHVFCAEHSSRLSVIFEKPPPAVFAPAPAAAAGAGAAAEVPSAVPVVFCDECLERRRFHPGTVCDKTAMFFAMRAVAANTRAGELAEWKQTVTPAVVALLCGPGVAPSTVPGASTTAAIAAASTAPNNGSSSSNSSTRDSSSSSSGRSTGLLSSLVLTTKDTWTTCAGCAAYFDRLSVRHTCALCRRAFCAQCGVAATPMATAVLVHVLGLDALRQHLARAGTAVPTRLEPRVCRGCARAYRRLCTEATLAARATPPAWLPRYEECLRIADGCAQTLALVAGSSSDHGSRGGRGTAPDAQAAARLCESAAAMLHELEDACAWLGSLATAPSTAHTRAEAALLRNVRARFVHSISSCKAQLVAVRAQLAARTGKSTPSPQQSPKP